MLHRSRVYDTLMEVDTDEELGPLPRTRDNANVTVTTVTSQTLYTEGETSAQAGLQARVEASQRKVEDGVP